MPPLSIEHAEQLLKSGRSLEAKGALEEIVASAPRNAYAYFLLGIASHGVGETIKAIDCFSKSSTLNPIVGDPYYNRGVLLHELGRFDEAILSFRSAVRLSPNFAERHYALGQSYYAAGQFIQAIASFNQAAKIRPNYTEAYSGLGNVEFAQGRYGDAVASYTKAIQINGSIPELYFNRGNAHHALQQAEEAIADYSHAIALNPKYADAYEGRAILLHTLNRLEEAVANHLKAIGLCSGSAEMHANLGLSFLGLEKPNEAIECFTRAIKFNSNLAAAFAGRAKAHWKLHKYETALADCNRAVEINPDLDFAAGMRLDCKMKLCDWLSYDSDVARLLQDVDRGKTVASPFTLLSLPATLAQQKRCAELLCQARVKQISNPIQRVSRPDQKIHLGYFGCEFHSHAVMFLTAELFERHDRSSFKVSGFSFGQSPNDAMRRRVAASFDHFYDVRDKSDKEIATFARSAEVDIAIDLAGHTLNSRIGIFAERAAPLQVQYLAYPGTLGATFIDYIIADSYVVPDSDKAEYSEKLIALPHCFQVNDTRRGIGPRPARSELGLTDSSFVFCSFSNPSKLNPALFEIWMNILRRASGSQLWLYGETRTLMSNLRNFAASKGVDPARLVFADQVPYSDHLARYQVADLVLDTFPFNGGTTTSDALWAGVPVVTRVGSTFASRMSGSLLRAIGLSELCAESAQIYEDLAVQLASQQKTLQSLKHRLEQNRLVSALFDVERTTRHIESGYRQIWERYRVGLPPDHTYLQ